MTGSIAAYRAPDIVRRLRDAGALVDVIMTDASSRFITPMTLSAVADAPVHTGMFDEPMAHIRLAAGADLMLVAPATADTIARMAHGMASDLLSACCLAFRGPLLVAPAMNWRMYGSEALGANLRTLRERGVIEIEPLEGSLACGEEGRGRMAEVARIVEAAEDALMPKDMAGRRVLVTAGPTREAIDPVRYISNRSSGRMGYAIARAARARGADVTLVTGPTALDAPSGVYVVRVETAEGMRQAVHKTQAEGVDVIVMAAAVADFTPASRAGQKLEKAEMEGIALKPTVDILAEASANRGAQARPLIVGFAAETGPNMERARQKMRQKGADMIAFNDVTEPGAGFDVPTNRVTVLWEGGQRELPMMDKADVAHALIGLVAERLGPPGA